MSKYQHLSFTYYYIIRKFDYLKLVSKEHYLFKKNLLTKKSIFKK